MHFVCYTNTQIHKQGEGENISRIILQSSRREERMKQIRNNGAEINYMSDKDVHVYMLIAFSPCLFRTGCLHKIVKKIKEIKSIQNEQQISNIDMTCQMLYSVIYMRVFVANGPHTLHSHHF